jgi:hypothetical protein
MYSRKAAEAVETASHYALNPQVGTRGLRKEIREHGQKGIGRNATCKVRGNARRGDEKVEP